MTFLLVAKHMEQKQLNDSQWLLDLAFLTDLTKIFNELEELHGKHTSVVNMTSSVNKLKMQLLSSKLLCHDLGNFPSYKSRAHQQFWNFVLEKYPNMRKCATFLAALLYLFM